MFFLLSILLFRNIIASAHPLSLRNVTLVLPEGLSTHGDPHLLCRPSRLSDVASFFLGNYVAHAATLKSLPGQPIFQSLLDLQFALLFPSSEL
ncbi:hypothetical protein BCR34DRAFT_641363 [Clohesyomyces aquaticus]|uniref:Secreted protein n=1 Tax=Clohesyomyces aquaticus TaxID=1231657 RepID=A0A1Y1YJW1_9PLEO|nr:hypothetical protein BCR34DRAFT_641363 [Clohesyomyces aquaticus]